MSITAEQINALGDKMSAIGQAAKTAQETATRAEDKAGNIDPAVQESITKASEAATQAVEELNQLKTEMTAIQKTSEYVEKAVARMGANDPKYDNQEMELKAADATARYLRTGQAFPDDVAENVVKALVSKSFFGVDEYKRESEIKTLIAGINPQGGYFIRPERSATMIRRIFETSPMRSVSNIETTTSDVLEFIIDDNEATSGGWVGETSPRGVTGTPNIGLLTIPVHEQFAQPKATQKMLDDAGFDIESWLSGKVTRKMTRFENSSFVLGDGSQKPRGILDYPTWNGGSAAPVYTRGAVEQVPSGIAGEYTADGIKKLKNQVIEEYQSPAVFGIKRESFENIITLKDGQGRFLLNVNSFKEGDTQLLLGKPVVFMTDIPGVAADALALVYGDFGVGYTIVDRMGFRVIRDELTEKPFIKFYTTKRVGGAVTNYESFKIQKLSVTVPAP